MLCKLQDKPSVGRDDAEEHVSSCIELNCTTIDGSQKMSHSRKLYEQLLANMTVALQHLGSAHQPCLQPSQCDMLDGMASNM